jgi:hypothetical protein
VNWPVNCVNIFGVFLHVMMPVTWLHNLTKDEAVHLADRLGIHLTGQKIWTSFIKP